MPEGSWGGTPTAFQEETEADPVPTPVQGGTATQSGNLTRQRPGQGSLVERLQEQIRMLEIRAGRAEQTVQDERHRRSLALEAGVAQG